MPPIRRSAALLLACLASLAAVPGCTGGADAYSRGRPWRASLAEQVDQDVQAMMEGIRRAHIGRWR